MTTTIDQLLAQAEEAREAEQESRRHAATIERELDRAAKEELRRAVTLARKTKMRDDDIRNYVGFILKENP